MYCIVKTIELHNLKSYTEIINHHYQKKKKLGSPPKNVSSAVQPGSVDASGCVVHSSMVRLPVLPENVNLSRTRDSKNKKNYERVASLSLLTDNYTIFIFDRIKYI